MVNLKDQRVRDVKDKTKIDPKQTMWFKKKLL